MSTVVEVVYEKGLFRPCTPVDLPEGARFELVVDQTPEAKLREIKARFPGVFGGFPKEDAEEIKAIIEAAKWDFATEDDDPASVGDGQLPREYASDEETAALRAKYPGLLDPWPREDLEEMAAIIRRAFRPAGTNAP